MPKKQKKKNSTKVVSLPLNGQGTQRVEGPAAGARPPRLQFIRDKSQLFELVSFAPLVLGALSVYGFQVQRFDILALLAVIVALSNGIDSLSKPEHNTSYTELMRGALVALQVLGVLGFVYVTRNLFATAVLAVLILVLMFRSKLEIESTAQVFLAATLLICQMILLSVLGQFSQTAAVYLPVSIFLGLVPGFLLAAALVAENALRFESAGWNRVRLITRKNGEVRRRPASLSTLFSMTLIFFPAIAVVLSFPPSYLIPTAYCAAVAVLAYTPKIAEAFFEGTSGNKEIFASVVNLSALMSVLLFLIGAFLAASQP